MKLAEITTVVADVLVLNRPEHLLIQCIQTAKCVRTLSLAGHRYRYDTQHILLQINKEQTREE